MKVTVVGSYQEPRPIPPRRKRAPDTEPPPRRKGASDKRPPLDREPPFTPNDFEIACSGIGRVLGQDGHRLIVAHEEDPETAESLALNGFRQEKNKYKYYSIITHPGDADLKAHLDAVEESDVVILIGGGNGTYASGLAALRRRKVMIPIPAFGGSAKDLCEIHEIDKTVVDKIRNLDFKDKDWLHTLTDAIRAVLNAFPRTLIIHGRGDNGNELKKEIIEESKDNESLLYGVAKPVIMNLSGSGAVTVPQVFENLASEVSAAIVIVTADDIGGFARIQGASTVPATELKLEVRARENVWVEVGWFWGRLGRERIFLWLKDKVEVPSDLQGVARTEASTLKDAMPSIKQFLIGMRTDEISSDDGLIR